MQDIVWTLLVVLVVLYSYMPACCRWSTVVFCGVVCAGCRVWLFAQNKSARHCVWLFAQEVLCGYWLVYGCLHRHTICCVVIICTGYHA